MVRLCTGCDTYVASVVAMLKTGVFLKLRRPWRGEQRDCEN